MTDATAVASAFERRREPGRALAQDADLIAAAAHAMAARFRDGGTLIVFGGGGTATDAQHVAVEFVHPVIVGKRALPALSLTNDVATVTAIAACEGVEEMFAAPLRLLARPGDIALGICAAGDNASVRRGLDVARELGLLTVALVGTASPDPDLADHVLAARSDDPVVVKEVHVTIYHLLWELAHVLLDQPGRTP